MQISVVIPAFNEEKFIRNSLNSLQQQTEKPDEIIVVDNLSRDNTVKIAKEFAVQIVEEKTTGIGDARNKGFNSAQYEIIARCDADTIVPPFWIKKIKKNFEQNIDALVGPIDYYDAIPRNTSASKAFINLMKKMNGFYPLLGLNMAIRQKMWKKVKNKVCLDDKQVHEDIDLAIHVNKEGGVIGYDPTLIVQSSARRINNNVVSFFIEYPARLIKTIKAPHL